MLADLARVPRLLVGADFDGTLAPIVDDPAAATALPASIEALRRLGRAPSTWVAVVSGRRYGELEARFGAEDFILVGEHGSDWGTGTAPEPPMLTRAREVVEEEVTITPGSFSEQKLASVAFHFRLASQPGPAVARLGAWAGTEPGIHLMAGKSVLELSADPLDKGMAVARLRTELAADAIMFVGDDTTDESVFSTLGETDLGVKVGPGPSAATMRLDGPEEVAALLTDLAALRLKDFVRGS